MVLGCNLVPADTVLATLVLNLSAQVDTVGLQNTSRVSETTVAFVASQGFPVKKMCLLKI